MIGKRVRFSRSREPSLPRPPEVRTSQAAVVMEQHRLPPPDGDRWLTALHGPGTLIGNHAHAWLAHGQLEIPDHAIQLIRTLGSLTLEIVNGIELDFDAGQHLRQHVVP